MSKPEQRRMKTSLIFAIIFITLVVVSDARTFTLINKCTQTAWFGFLSGAGSQNITPSDNNYQLAANGGKKVVNIPSVQWSGVIAGRTGCTNTSCVTADCGGGQGACSHGFQPPATQAEFTLNPSRTDFYDVEIINGFNIPISITPSISSHASNPYFCGSPGARTPSAGLGGCDWNLQPPRNEYKWVTNTGGNCTSDNQCGSGKVCGLSFNPGFQQLLQMKCGNLLGYWSADQICGVQRDYGSPFNCSSPVPGQSGITWWNLMACVGVDTCYKNGAVPSCCGCANWDQEGLPVPKAPITQRCQSTNPNWNSTILPTLLWLKKACPTAYTYPFDDASSTFTCGSTTGANTVSYTITFCP